MSVKPLSVYYVRTKDLDKSIAFYSELLGVKLKKKNESVAMGELGSLSIVIQKAGTAGLTQTTAFAVDNLDNSVSIAQEMGGTLRQGKQDGEQGESVLLTDPDGNQIEVVHLK